MQVKPRLEELCGGAGGSGAQKCEADETHHNQGRHQEAPRQIVVSVAVCLQGQREPNDEQD